MSSLLKRIRRYVNREPMNLVDSFGPTHVVLKMFGLCPYQSKNCGENCTYEATRSSAVYSLAFILIFIGYYIFAVEVHIELDSLRQTHGVTATIDLFYLCFTVTEVTIIIVMTVGKRRVILGFFEKMDLIDKSFIQKGVMINYSTHRWLMCAYVIIVILEIGTLEFWNCTMFLNERAVFSRICWVMCNIPLLIEALTECYFIILTLTIRHRLVLLNDGLRSLSKFRFLPNHQAKMVVDARKTHIELCEASHILNSAFCLQILIIVASDFLNFTTNTYHCIKEFMYMRKEHNWAFNYALFTSSLWVISRLSKLVFISVACALTKKEADGSIRTAYQLNPKVNSEVSREINSFGKQSLHWYINFTAFDFFSLNMAMLYGVCCTAATYLTILFQLDSTIDPAVNTSMIIREM